MRNKIDMLHAGKLKEQIKAQEKKIRQKSNMLEGLQRLYTSMERTLSPEATKSRQTLQKFREEIQIYIDRLKDDMDVLGAFKDVLEKAKKQGDES